MDELTVLSRDMRLRVLEAAGPGIANSPSWLGLRGVLDRCDRVDLRSDVVRRIGDVAPDMGELLKEKVLVRSL
jgi:hypothetical protein